MLAAVRVLLVGLAAVAALGAPSGLGVGAADLSPPVHDDRLAGALDLLASNPDTLHLRDVLDSSGVGIQFSAMAPGIYARYSVQRRTIEIDSRWAEATPETLAAVIAHEATHAEDAVSGYLATGGTRACIDSEVRAFHTAARFWLGHFGPAGKPQASTDLERQLNLIAQRERADPASLETVIRQTYTGQCAH
jgi:hypothetical protein